MLKAKLIIISLVLVLAGLAQWACTPTYTTHLVYQADFTGIPADEQQSSLEVTKKIIENRVNALGVAKPLVRIQGTNRISVQLPDVEDIDEMIKLIGTNAKLDFRKLAETAADGKTGLAVDLSEGATTLSLVDASNFTAGSNIRIGAYKKNSNGENDYVIASIDTDANTITVTTGATILYTVDTSVAQWIQATGVIDDVPTQLTGKHFASDAKVGYDTSRVPAQPILYFNLKGDGPVLFGQITEGLINKQLGIFLDNVCMSSPIVMEKLTDGGIISGFELDEAKLLVIQLNSGALPLKLVLVSQQEI